MGISPLLMIPECMFLISMMVIGPKENDGTSQKKGQ